MLCTVAHRLRVNPAFSQKFSKAWVIYPSPASLVNPLALQVRISLLQWLPVFIAPEPLAQVQAHPLRAAWVRLWVDNHLLVNPLA
jgi:hypothetical protein